MGLEQIFAGPLLKTVIGKPQPNSDASSRARRWTYTGPSLMIFESSGKHLVYSMNSARLTIGRSHTNDIVLNADSVSRLHGEFLFENGQYIIRDNDSTNGITIENERIVEKPLENGCEIHLGDEKLKFIYEEREIPWAERVGLLNRSSAFSDLDQDTKQELARKMSVRFYPKGALVLNPNAPLECIYFVVTGQLHILERNEEGGERLIQKLLPNTCFGDQNPPPGQNLRYHVFAAEPTWVLELRQEQLVAFANKKPDLESTVVLSIKKAMSTGPHDLKNSGLPVSDGQLDEVHLVGKSRKFLGDVAKASKIFDDGFAPLIVGPPGAGKKILARHCHKAGFTESKACLEISLAEMDALSVDGAIFGVEADPKASHIKAKKGWLEILEGGTLIIAHAERLSPHLQSKLLTYLKRGWFHRQYAQSAIKAQTRVILLATGEKSKVFSYLIPELQFELEDMTVCLSPLSKRLKDIPVLAEHFLARYAKKAAKEVTKLSNKAKEKLVTYTWPGNIAELENVIQRAVCVSEDKTIIPGDLIFVTPREKDKYKVNILRNANVRTFLRHPLLFKLFTWFNIFMLGSVAAVTLFGGLHASDYFLRHGSNNPGMLLTWLVWFPLLPISALLLGRAWCGICPIAGIGDLLSRFYKLNLPVPKILRRMDFWLLAASFLFLDFIEKFIEVDHEPLSTGLLLVAIVLASVTFCILYERKTFCRYICPLAGLLGAYATMSPVEVRGSRKVCQTQCGDQACYKGSDTAPGCPLSSYPASLDTNAECMMCGNCLRNCKNRGIQVNLRPPLHELWRRIQPRLSISLFGVMLVGLMARHQFSDLPAYEAIQTAWSLSPNGTYSVLFVAFIFLALVFFSINATLSATALNEKIRENMATYGLAFIPLAFAGHMSRVTHEFLYDGIYELIGFGQKCWAYLTSGISPAHSQIVVPHFIQGQVVTLLKFMILFGGFAASAVALIMITRQAGKQNIYSRCLPHLLTLVIFGAAYLKIFLA